jgi:hypothetical protein
VINKETHKVVGSLDPTSETRGWHRANKSTRGLLVKTDTSTAPFFRGATAKRCIGGPVTVHTADGRSYTMQKNRRAKRTIAQTPAKSVTIRRKMLRADISTYLLVAERIGLNLQTVATLYRERSNNGYQYDKTVTTNETYSFRGSEV